LKNTDRIDRKLRSEKAVPYLKFKVDPLVQTVFYRV